MNQYVIVTNIDTLDTLGMTMYEFDQLTDEEKLEIEHTKYSLEELVDELNSCDVDHLNPEYNVFTVITE